MGIGWPFSLLRAVRVISSSRAAVDRVFEKQLVEIAQAEHQQRVRHLLLDAVVLPHQRRGSVSGFLWLTHGGNLYCPRTLFQSKKRRVGEIELSEDFIGYGGLISRPPWMGITASLCSPTVSI